MMLLATVLALLCTSAVKAANSYDKVNKLDSSVRYLFEAGFNMFGSDYAAKSLQTTEILVKNPDLVPNYNYNILPSVVMSINPCEYDLEYCKVKGMQSLVDSPVIKKSKLCLI